MDVSEVRQLLGPSLQMAAVFDAFSRVPLALQIFDAKPTARDMARLLKRAVGAFGPAVPDHRSRDGIHGTGVPQGHASSWHPPTLRLQGQHQGHGSPRTLLAHAQANRRTPLTLAASRPSGSRAARGANAALLPLLPSARESAGSDSGRGLPRPATRASSAVEPPRGRPGEGPRQAPFQIQYLDPGTRSFPILKPAA